MRFQSYFNTAVKIIQLYDGAVPLQYYLKEYFSKHKKHGSTDRKIIMHVCYNFYRLGKALFKLDTEERLKLAIFICNDEINNWNFLYDEEWLSNHNDSLETRIKFIRSKYSAFSLTSVFPFADDVNNDLDFDTFATSFFIQPDVFLRIRPNHFDDVIARLQQHKMIYHVIEENCIAFSPAVNINTVINIDEEAVIQDYSSQQIKHYFELVKFKIDNSELSVNVWDCCAGSGGKSILAYDVLQNINLTVSDIRTSIIQNLTQRFAKAGIKHYKSLVADVTGANFTAQSSTYNLIICDAPCTGSGTWSRTPEQLYFFKPGKIDAYAKLQQQIISNAITALKNNGYFLYITCSVFKKENELMVYFIKQNFNVELMKTELIKGYNKKADTMFAALFKNKS